MKYRRFIGVLFDLNLFAQGLYDLVTPVLLSLLAAWLLSAKAGVGRWIYAVLLPPATLFGLYTMIRYYVKVLPQFEKQREEQDAARVQALKNNDTKKGEPHDN